MMMHTTESDRRIVEIAQALGGRMLVDTGAIREVVPDATVLEVYCALTALRDVLDALAEAGNDFGGTVVPPIFS